MATRSGKTYHESQGSRRRNVIKETSTTPNGKCSDDTLDVSSISNRDLRSRRSSTKNSTFDKSDVSIKKSSLDNATESNWVISDLTIKIDRTLLNMIASSNKSTIAEKIKKPAEINASRVSTKQLRTRKLNGADTTSNKIDETVNTTYEKDTEKDYETEAMEEKNTNKDLKSKVSEMNRNQLDLDTENDLNSLNVGKSLRKKKKKVKASKKKKLKGKPKEDIIEESPSNNVKIINTTFEKDTDAREASIGNNVDLNISKTKAHKHLDSNSSNVSNSLLRNRKSYVKDTTFEKEDIPIDTTYDKDDEIDRTFNKDLDADSTGTTRENGRLRKSSVHLTLNRSSMINDTLAKDESASFDTFKKGAKLRKSSITYSSFNKINISTHSISQEKQNSIPSSPANKRTSLRRRTMDISHSPSLKLNTTFEKTSNADTEATLRTLQYQWTSKVPVIEKLNTTFDKEVTKSDDDKSKSSLISSDNSSVSRVSITSDDSSENIINATPVLIESSIDETYIKESPKKSPEKMPMARTPLKREGTFTKEAPEVQSPQTPGKRGSAVIPTAGCTPYHVSKGSQKKPMLNVTRSIEKRLSIDPDQRMTRVMFCSPIDHPAPTAQEKRKIIKSNLKGSNKSFVFDESVTLPHPRRKRSYTQNDAENERAKRSRLTEDLQHSVDRLSRPRTGSTTTKPTETTPKKVNSTPFKSKSETKPARTRLPNFAALHQKQFAKMESLGECQERKAKRARQMLTPTAPTNVLDRISPKSNNDPQKPTTKELAKPKDKSDTPAKKPPTLESLRPGFTRFGFKLNLDINPFSIPSKNEKPKEKLNGAVPKPGPAPSLTGTTSGRRVAAKQTVMREKSFVDKRKAIRSENRTIIKGVRTNRRFELQMKLRNVD